MQEKGKKFLPFDRDRSRMAETVAPFTIAGGETASPPKSPKISRNLFIFK